MSSEKTTKQNKKQQAPKIGLGFYTLGEEIANSITHGLGALLGIAGTVVLIVFAALTHDPWKIVSVCIYHDFSVYDVHAIPRHQQQASQTGISCV